MGTGLGKNSPVVLTLGKENYEALITRHGQWVRWRVASKCPCVKSGTMQADIHCTKCGGLGVTYSYQKKEEVLVMVMVMDSNGIIDLGEDYRDDVLIKCYDNSGVIYDAAEKIGQYVLLNTDTPPIKGVYVTAILTQEVLKTLSSATCEKVGAGFYRVPGLQSRKTNIEGLWHTAPGDIETIGEIKDAEGRVYEAKELRQDCFYIEKQKETITELDEEENEIEIEKEIEIAEPITVSNVKYIPPFTFVILSQELKKSDNEIVQEMNGDAMLTVPYTDDVSSDDVLTVLSGTYTLKAVVTRKKAEYDVLPVYFADTVLECIGKERSYTQGKDFLLLGANYIKWLCEDAPDEGEAYSVTYKAFPTYKVVKAIPQIRTSENQRMPKKAVIKMYDTYGDARGINRQ